MRTLIDGYPLPDDDPDFEIQLRINDYLSGPADEPSMQATASQVLGETRANERYRWLIPLLRRAEWLLEHPGGAKPHWASHLTCTVSLLLNHNREQSEEELLTLLGYSGVFRQTNEYGGLDELKPRILEAFRKTSEKRRWVEALESAAFEFDQFDLVYGGRSAAFVGMLLLTEPSAAAQASPCWSTHVAGDAKAEKKTAAAWRNLFLLADTHFLFPREPAEAKVSAAIGKLGVPEFASRLNAWTAYLGDGQAVHLSWRGLAVLKILLHGATAAAVPDVQPSLMALSKAKWKQVDRARFSLDVLVQAIARQPDSFAKACLSQLAEQPYAAENAALKVALESGKETEMPLGIDGYPLDSRPVHSAFQRRMDACLREPSDALRSYYAPGPDLHSLSRSGENADYPGFLAALLDRLDWLRTHSELIPTATHMRSILSRRVLEVLKAQPEMDRASLIHMVEADAKGSIVCSPGELMLASLERYIDGHGFDAELVKAIDVWHRSNYGSISSQALRKHIGWLLWQEDVTAVNLKTCWSGLIQQDLRDMPKAQSASWRKLLAAVSFQTSDTPPAKWTRQVGPLRAAIGIAEFAQWFHRWIQPFQTGAPLPLEATGASLLRCLFWHAAAVEDPKIDEALTFYPLARWKNKKSKSLTSKLIGPYILALSKRPDPVAHRCLEKLVANGDIQEPGRHYDEYLALCGRVGLSSRQGVAPPVPVSPQDNLMRTLKRMGCEVSGDIITVKGAVETYTVHRSSREIRRQSDHAKLQIEANGGDGPIAEALVGMSQISVGGSETMRETMALLFVVQVLTMDSQFAGFIREVRTETWLQ